MYRESLYGCETLVQAHTESGVQTLAAFVAAYLVAVTMVTKISTPQFLWEQESHNYVTFNG